jgi:hypothetical protein
MGLASVRGYDGVPDAVLSQPAAFKSRLRQRQNQRISIFRKLIMILEVLNVHMLSADPIFCESIKISCHYRRELSSAADEQ